MDISSITASNATCEIRHPATSEPVGLRIFLRPASHPEVKRMERQHQNETLKDRGKLTAEKLEARILDRIVASTDGWQFDSGVTIGGSVPEFNAANARKLYKDYDFIRSQVSEALGDDANFYGGAN